MNGALVTFIAKVKGVVEEKFSWPPPLTPVVFAPPPPIKIPGGATASVRTEANSCLWFAMRKHGTQGTQGALN